jgi:outer membrane biosynthesis protein TonB
MGGSAPLTLSANILHGGRVATSGRRQVASLDRRISAATNHNQGTIMLRMMLLGLLIPLGVGALAAMELRTPPRILVTAVQPAAETQADISDSHAALAKADRLEITYAKSETPAQPDPVDERIVAPEATTIGSPEAPRIINHPRHDPKPRKVATATLPKPKPKTTDLKRMAARERSKAAGDTEPCRLSAFGGLQKALNSSDCQI